MTRSILLVDDVQMFIEIQKEYLQDSRVDILTARNGLDALRVMKSKRPDLIFMDFHMPMMDGAACCRVIKSDPGLREIPVVMITALGKTADKVVSETSGCNDFLTKPLDRDLFLEAAKRYIPGIERREKRIPVNINAQLRTNGTTLKCTLKDLSTGGAYVVSDYETTIKSVFQISFTLPDNIMIECHARVAWINSNIPGIPQGFGVQFALLTNSAKDAIANLIGTFYFKSTSF